jgi:hypothetical protein
MSTLPAFDIKAAPRKLIVLALGGVVMTAVSAVTAFALLPGAAPSLFDRALCAIGVVFFALCTLVALWRLATQRGAVVTLAPEGIRDTRVAAEAIPWSAVRGIATWSAFGQRVMVLDVDPETEKRLSLSAVARNTRSANKALGADGLCVTAQGIDAAYDEVLARSRNLWSSQHAA